MRKSFVLGREGWTIRISTVERRSTSTPTTETFRDVPIGFVKEEEKDDDDGGGCFFIDDGVVFFERRRRHRRDIDCTMPPPA